MNHIAEAKNFVQKIEQIILFPLITLLFAVALLVFFWGAFQFIYQSDDETARQTGKRHMFYGVIGMLVMISAYTILQIALATFGVECILSNPSCKS